ncbi:MAG: type II toxin-antitoxin system RelE/ParE family toxin [Ardenticatenaceae bacterium]|nr:type II toxin-antitoxin system RelE/ParE family toxin [Anaerolineales bacterium]MCB8923362.1 type II toxin-antitoxin system RelE/ParE family toxin [Ardenticatenaceae bacterium]
MYKVIITKQADKALRKMSVNDSHRIHEKLALLAQDPYAPNNNVIKLTNRVGYRLRVGDWRILYDVIAEEVIIYVFKIAPRGGVYK